MSYSLAFLPSAQKEWRKLGDTVRVQFKKKLAERLLRPRIASDALHGMPHHYKIKLRQVGYRLVYRVDDNVLTVLVVAVGRRDHSDVYEAAKRR
ncbi:type II toxin-antitoxin system RelE family toxin [Bosea sp. (in: a-proteobacteria)]|jgi:mRNA interferase RelE/StbE|uniref:type II toxin-antitoxin system RelE family toxin n=1 Tax=Bosea sp. (in: a-proteobacteria) TaxID=1871050 RepID=UPI0022BBE5F1|nr:type II toxin-antitoxin system RelE/ParE family toxin [Bosea sp. (in: a-proteobacteria)]MCZ8043753.1 type II toxin-antitoxin system RelE/ParE family toxin [Beijerinckiaceae bacterium]WRH59217.1 MAG: type II toxin-antitoxin system RelE/ParE family toxin [Bosea sp. (in: a-proteobacteria)]